MKNNSLSFTQPNQAWILHREDLDTIQDGLCHTHILLDAYSGFCFNGAAILTD